MRARAAVLLSLVLASAPIAAALPGPPPAPATDGGDRPPIRVHGDEQFLLPSSGVTGGSGSAEDPYVISGWTVRPLHVKRLDSPDDGVGKYCKPSPVVTPAQIRTVRLHAIEIVDTSAHVRIENVTVLPRADQANGMVDSRHLIGILLRDADHVTIRNVTVGEPSGERLYRGICARNSDDLTVRDSTVQRTEGDGLKVKNSRDLRIVDNTIVASSGGQERTEGIDLDDVGNVRVASNAVRDHADEVMAVRSGTDVRIVGNTIADARDTGLDVGFGDGIVIQTNVVENSGRDGIDVDSSSNVAITDNNIQGNQRTGVDANGMDLDLRDNWWGDGSGPSGGVTDDCTGATADGSGDAIEARGDVCFDPWRSSPNPNAGA